MSSLFSRPLAAVLAVLAGVPFGWWLGALGGQPLAGAMVGGVLCVLAVVGFDALRGYRLVEWLRGAQTDSAPRDSGFWGELGYRIERALRSRDATAAAERDRLEQFLSAIEASPNGVLMLDANDEIEWCNSVAADHFGLDPTRDRRQRMTNLVRAPAFVAYLQSGDFTHPVSFGDPRTLSVLVRPYGGGQRLVLSQDVTELERADAMRRDFVANVSHEMRTPLTVLAGFVESMATLELTGVEKRRVLQLMTQQTERMRAVVADLLQLAQLEGSPRPAADHWSCLSKLMQRAEADAVALSAGRHVFHFDGDADIEIAGSETEIQSAIGNLVGNAVRYTPAGGRVEVAWRRRADGGAEIDVIDTGPGIAREHLPRLTERFYRVDGSRSRDTGGTGLGLAIVKHVVQRHGGDIDIASEVGQGSRFRVVLPAARVRSSAEAGALR